MGWGLAQSWWLREMFPEELLCQPRLAGWGPVGVSPADPRRVWPGNQGLQDWVLISTGSVE